MSVVPPHGSWSVVNETSRIRQPARDSPPPQYVALLLWMPYRNVNFLLDSGTWASLR